MNHARLSVIALLLAVASMAIAFARRRPPSPSDHARSDKITLEKITAMENRLASLDDELSRLRRSLNTQPPLARVPIQPIEAADRTLPPNGALDELATRIAEMEATLSEHLARGTRGPSPEFPTRLSNKDPEEFEDDTAGWTRVALDPMSTPEQSLAALRRLRFQRLEDGSDARIPVLSTMIELAQTSPEGEVRADVWRQLSGVTDLSLLQPLLHALANDSHAKAREEAAETLADFLPDPVVEAALIQARDLDSDRGVREQAVRSLSAAQR